MKNLNIILSTWLLSIMLIGLFSFRGAEISYNRDIDTTWKPVMGVVNRSGSYYAIKLKNQ